MRKPSNCIVIWLNVFDKVCIHPFSAECKQNMYIFNIKCSLSYVWLYPNFESESWPTADWKTRWLSYFESMRSRILFSKNIKSQYRWLIYIPLPSLRYFLDKTKISSFFCLNCYFKGRIKNALCTRYSQYDHQISFSKKCLADKYQVNPFHYKLEYYN